MINVLPNFGTCYQRSCFNDNAIISKGNDKEIVQGCSFNPCCFALKIPFEPTCLKDQTRKKLMRILAIIHQNAGILKFRKGIL
jgi:hypothetical protein